jgi:hypothetical protein
MKMKLLKMLVKYVNLKGLLIELVCEVADEALDKVVAGTKNPMDNMVKAALWPVFEEEAKKLIEDKLDLEKIFKIEE